MNKKQKKVLIRIIAAVVLLIALAFVPSEGWLQFALYMIPYLVIGYDILKKAVKGILNRQVFDENFLMAVATIGAIALGDYKEGVAVKNAVKLLWNIFVFFFTYTNSLSLYSDFIIYHKIYNSDCKNCVLHCKN